MPLGLGDAVLLNEPALSWLDDLPASGAHDGLGFSKELSKE
jgi:hypothetical protein